VSGFAAPQTPGGLFAPLRVTSQPSPAVDTVGRFFPPSPRTSCELGVLPIFFRAKPIPPAFAVVIYHLCFGACAWMLCPRCLFFANNPLLPTDFGGQNCDLLSPRFSDGVLPVAPLLVGHPCDRLVVCLQRPFVDSHEPILELTAGLAYELNLTRRLGARPPGRTLMCYGKLSSCVCCVGPVVFYGCKRLITARPHFRPSCASAGSVPCAPGVSGFDTEGGPT